MKMKNKFALLSVMACSAVCMQASSLTTLVQCAVPVVSGVTGYKSLQGSLEQNEFQQQLQSRGEIKKEAMFEKITTMNRCASKKHTKEYNYDLSIATAAFSLGMVGTYMYTQEPVNLVVAAVMSTVAVGSHLYGRKRFDHAKEVVNAMPSEIDIESQQLIAKSCHDTFGSKK